MEWVKSLLDWYRKNARALPWRNTCDPYHILVSEVMLQQTRVNAVLSYYERFLAAFPTLMDLAVAPEDRLLKLWEGLGYYSRARNLQRTARHCAEHYGGKLPNTYEELLKLPGLGEYTAGAVASIGYGIPVPAVDGNVLRVLSRLFCDERDILNPRTKKAMRELLLTIMPRGEAACFNQALMELGACVCYPNGAPGCASCPISEHCRAHALGRELTLPVRQKKQPRRLEQRTVFVLLDGGRPLVYRRQEGVLKGLWQLPDTVGHLSPEEATAFLTAQRLRPVGELTMRTRKHIFTHIEWEMRVYAMEIAQETILPAGWRVLDETIALPTAYRICLS